MGVGGRCGERRLDGEWEGEREWEGEPCGEHCTRMLPSEPGEFCFRRLLRRELEPDSQPSPSTLRGVELDKSWLQSSSSRATPGLPVAALLRALWAALVLAAPAALLLTSPTALLTLLAASQLSLVLAQLLEVQPTQLLSLLPTLRHALVPAPPLEVLLTLLLAF